MGKVLRSRTCVWESIWRRKNHTAVRLGSGPSPHVVTTLGFAPSSRCHRDGCVQDGDCADLNIVAVKDAEDEAGGVSHAETTGELASFRLTLHCRVCRQMATSSILPKNLRLTQRSATFSYSLLQSPCMSPSILHSPPLIFLVFVLTCLLLRRHTPCVVTTVTG